MGELHLWISELNSVMCNIFVSKQSVYRNTTIQRISLQNILLKLKGVEGFIRKVAYTKLLMKRKMKEQFSM